MLCKMLCSLYNQTEPWKVAATLYNGTVYLQEIETEEKRRQEAIMPPQQRATCYWGLKFEDYVTSRGIYMNQYLWTSNVCVPIISLIKRHRPYSPIETRNEQLYGVIHFAVNMKNCCFKQYVRFHFYVMRSSRRKHELAMGCKRNEI